MPDHESHTYTISVIWVWFEQEMGYGKQRDKKTEHFYMFSAKQDKAG
jgi:hypothetical protein